MAEAEYRRLECSGCKTELTGRRRKWCSTTCKERQRNPMTREEYRAQCKVDAKGYFTCEHCGRESYRNASGAATEHGYANRWCSMACRVERAERIRREVEFLQGLAKQARAARRKPRYALGVQYTPPVRHCPHCGCKWSAIRRLGAGLVCPSDDCQRVHRAEVRKRKRSSKSHVKRAKRHGRLYGYWNVQRVFERDRWTCKVCGTRTPKTLRGTQDPRAPELGHIIALADGGDHVLENCQCECRACNAAKGTRARGQLWLAGFADTK